MTPLIIFLGVAAFVFGLIIGSFLNVCIYRLPREESLVYPPSHCPKCNQPIRPEDNIPIISWFMLRGRCRSCGQSISLIYPTVELFTGVLFVLYFVRFADLYMRSGAGEMPEYLATGDILYYGAFYMVNMAFICALFVATVVDFKLFIIPDAISVPGIPLAMAASLAFPQMHDSMIIAGHPHLSSLAMSVIGAAVGAGTIYGIGAAGKAVLGKEAMGFGDVKLMGLIGAFLGWQLTIFTILLSAALGTVYGLIYLAMTGKSRIPYGPFLSAAAVIALILKPQVLAFLDSIVQTYRFLFHANI